MIKTAVISVQDENWEDDGGDHCPKIYEISPADLAKLQAWEQQGPQKKHAVESLLSRSTEVNAPQYPISVDGVFEIWTTSF